MKSVAGWTVAVVIALACIGCGGQKVASRSNSGFDFQTRASRICAQRSKSGDTPTSEAVPFPSFVEIATARARTAQELSALTPPSALRSGYRRLVSLIFREAALYRRLGRYLRDGNDAGAQATHRELRTNAVPKQALLLGLAKCA
jgi:hypothetical protein